MGNNCCSAKEDVIPTTLPHKIDQKQLESVREKYRLRVMPIWGQANSDKGIETK